MAENAANQQTPPESAPLTAPGAAAPSTAQTLGSATYEIIRQRLQTQGAALRERMAFRGPHGVERRIVGGLLGQWAVGTRRAVEMLHTIRRLPDEAALDPAWFRLATALTELNAALFDAPNGFRGCIAGVHEGLRRQGLLEGTWCLDPAEGLSPGQAEEIERAVAAHPDLLDDRFIADHRDRWLAG